MKQMLWIRRHIEPYWAQEKRKGELVNQLLENYYGVSTPELEGVDEELIADAVIQAQESNLNTSEFGELEPCHGHQMRMDCGRPLCKYGAGK